MFVLNLIVIEWDVPKIRTFISFIFSDMIARINAILKKIDSPFENNKKLTSQTRSLVHFG